MIRILHSSHPNNKLFLFQIENSGISKINSKTSFIPKLQILNISSFTTRLWCAAERFSPTLSCEKRKAFITLRALIKLAQ